MSDDLKKKLGSRIAELREDRKLTQLKLAELVGINITTLSKIEIGQKFLTSDTLARIAEVLDVEYNELFTFKDKETHQETYNECKNLLDNISKYHPELLSIAKIFLKLLKQK